mmetsp:Transcript_39409/g.118000  ORF Transcript_39409/g.118000 Transcript_39409/m.118000 type:complete len:101 (+) Transcript_39409:842-1144(+)
MPAVPWSAGYQRNAAGIPGSARVVAVRDSSGSPSQYTPPGVNSTCGSKDAGAAACVGGNDGGKGGGGHAGSASGNDGGSRGGSGAGGRAGGDVASGSVGS